MCSSQPSRADPRPEQTEGSTYRSGEREIGSCAVTFALRAEPSQLPDPCRPPSAVPKIQVQIAIGAGGFID
jgi:hypothetical protein